MRLLIVVAISSMMGAQTLSTRPKGNAQYGKQLFSRDGCYECHGLEAQGGTAGSRIGPRPLAIEAFTQYVRKPIGQMPPYTAKVISDQELADIHAFLESLPEPLPVKSVPMLNH